MPCRHVIVVNKQIIEVRNVHTRWLKQYGCGKFDCIYKRKHDAMSYPNLIARYEPHVILISDKNKNTHSSMLSALFFNDPEPETENNTEITSREHEETKKGRHMYLDKNGMICDCAMVVNFLMIKSC